MADFYKAVNGRSHWVDAPATGEANVGVNSPDYSARRNGDNHAPYNAATHPVNNGSGNISYPQNATQGQLPPMVQPLIIVPYASQMQPLYQYTPEAMENGYYYGQENGNANYGQDYGQAYADPNQGYIEEKANQSTVKSKKKINGLAIVIILLSIITAALLVLPKFVKLPDIVNVMKGKSGLAVILTLPDLLKGKIDIMNLLVPGLLALSALFTVLVLLTSLFSVTAKRIGVIALIFAALAFVTMAGATVFGLVKKLDVQVGLYVLTGLNLVAFVALIAFRKRKRV